MSLDDWDLNDPNCDPLAEARAARAARENGRASPPPPPGASEPPGPSQGREEAGESGSGSSWLPVALDDYLDGTHDPPLPELLRRSDGVGMLYPGRVHWCHGESESGKSWVAQIATVEVLAGGGRVVYLDFESTPDEVLARLLLLGADPEVLRERFHYTAPQVSSDKDVKGFAALLGGCYGLVVIDGVTESLGLYGTSSNDSDEVTAWGRKLPRRIARKTGAAVVCIDHVTKSEEGRGRYPIGSQAKVSLLDGCAYVVEPKDLAPGKAGWLIVRVGKDRAGQVRKHSGPFRASDRTQETARIRIDSTDPQRIKYEVRPFVEHVDPETGRATFRPTLLMERASRYIEVNPEQSKTDISDRVSGNAKALRTAIDVLFEEGYVSAVAYTARGKEGHRYRTNRPYREAEDPQSDKFRGSSEARDWGPPLKGGGLPDPSRRGTPQTGVQDSSRTPVDPSPDQAKQSDSSGHWGRPSKIADPSRTPVGATRSSEDPLLRAGTEADKITSRATEVVRESVRSDSPAAPTPSPYQWPSGYDPDAPPPAQPTREDHE